MIRSRPCADVHSLLLGCIRLTNNEPHVTLKHFNSFYVCKDHVNMIPNVSARAVQALHTTEVYIKKIPSL